MNLSWLLKFICAHPVNRQRKAGAIADFIYWQISSRLSKGTISYSWINGSKMLVRHGDSGFTMNIYCGLQDFSDMGFLLHFLRPEDLFVDVGANVGAYTILASAARGAQAISYEPAPETFARLTGNLECNQLGARVRTRNAGAAEKAGRIRFSSGHNCQNHVLGTGDMSTAIEIPVVTLDEDLQGRSPALMKIDVEGFEFSVLRGATFVLHNPRLHALLLEVNEDTPEYGFTRQAVLDLLDEAGFGLFRYDPIKRALITLSPVKDGWGNSLFLRRSALEQIKERLRSSSRFRVKNLDL